MEAPHVCSRSCQHWKVPDSPSANVRQNRIVHRIMRFCRSLSLATPAFLKINAQNASQAVPGTNASLD